MKIDTNNTYVKKYIIYLSVLMWLRVERRESDIKLLLGMSNRDFAQNLKPNIFKTLVEFITITKNHFCCHRQKKFLFAENEFLRNVIGQFFYLRRRRRSTTLIMVTFLWHVWKKSNIFLYKEANIFCAEYNSFSTKQNLMQMRHKQWLRCRIKQL